MRVTKNKDDYQQQFPNTKLCMFVGEHINNYLIINGIWMILIKCLKRLDYPGKFLNWAAELYSI